MISIVSDPGQSKKRAASIGIPAGTSYPRSKKRAEEHEKHCESPTVTLADFITFGWLEGIPTIMQFDQVWKEGQDELFAFLLKIASAV